MKRIAPTKVLWACIFLLIISVFCAMATGAINIPFHDFFMIILNTILFNSIETQNYYHAIIIDIRLPRVLLAVFVGAILAVSGAIMQGLFRNPLADPSLVGVTAGASLGASLVIVFVSHTWLGVLGIPVVSLGAFIGSVISVYFVYTLAKSPFGTSVTTMLLAGIGITAFVGSITSFLEFYANNEMLRRISLWRMGGLEGASFDGVLLAGVVGFLIMLVIPRWSLALNALLLGESEARHLGVNTERLKKMSIVLVAAGVGISVALTGAIAFVGLVIPHIFRLLIGPDHRYLLPISAVGGAVLLVVADNVSRVALAPVELPIGLVTAFIGVPFFISLLRHRNRLGDS